MSLGLVSIEAILVCITLIGSLAAVIHPGVRRVYSTVASRR
jgi:hypothetical protein